MIDSNTDSAIVRALIGANENFRLNYTVVKNFREVPRNVISTKTCCKQNRIRYLTSLMRSTNLRDKIHLHLMKTSFPQKIFQNSIDDTRFFDHYFSISTSLEENVFDNTPQQFISKVYDV